MDETLSKSSLDVIYDGQCRFCERSLALLRWLAGRLVFRLHDANDDEKIRSNFPMIGDANTNDAMFVVTTRGEIFRGFFAYRRILWESPRLYPLLPVFYAPGAALLGQRIYALVARNRRYLGCSLDRAEQCGGPSAREGTAASMPGNGGVSVERGETSRGGAEMTGLILQPTGDRDTRADGQALDRSKRVHLQKAFAALLGCLVMGGVLAPIVQNWRASPKDNFPLSYYPMFSEKRRATYLVNYLVGVDGEGNRQLIPHQFAGRGGFNQTRRQINKLEREGKASVLCRAVAGKVARKAASPYSGIVTIRVVSGRFRFADYFTGKKAPLAERVRASCQVLREARITEDETSSEDESSTEDEP
jgi:predicted DCC family thiol-disulfide oxidoreductase YuxK